MPVVNVRMAVARTQSLTPMETARLSLGEAQGEGKDSSSSRYLRMIVQND